MHSLRKLSIITFTGTALLLAFLIVTGLQQHSLMDDYNTIVKESESTMFFYSTLREQTTEGLLSRNSTQLIAATKEIEKLQSRYVAMLDNRLIPSQYKLSFVQNLDLEQLVLDLKNLAESPNDIKISLKILTQLRQINNQFLQFDRIVISEMRNKVIHAQKTGLILMGFIIVLITFTLITFYKKSVKALISFTSAATQSLKSDPHLPLHDEKKNCAEINILIAMFNQLLQNPTDNSSDTLKHHSREAEFSVIINEVTNRLNGIINNSQLLADYCEANKVDEEQRQIVYKIIKNGEKSAAILQKGLPGTDV